VSVAPPLVTVGMPVRNGGRMFAAALQSVLKQDHANLEILVSDNGSTDETAVIAQAAAAADPRVVYTRQPTFLRAFDNLMSLVPLARGKYFMWAAHDDLRSPDFISTLLRGFEATDVLLSFGDLEIMTVHGSAGVRKAYDFDATGLGRISRIRKQALMECYHIYGLWRTDALAALPKVYCQWWADLPMMMAAAAVGRFRYVPGPVFRYYFLPKRDDERALYQDNLRRSSSKLRNIFELIFTSFKVMLRTAGPAAALMAVIFVAEKNLRFAVIALRRRMRAIPIVGPAD
jgi:glycosyltransferase involved in cell wall biosynthesis